MTIQRLNQYRHLKREIPSLRRQIDELRGKAEQHTTVMGSSPEPPYTLRSIQVEAPECSPDVRDTLAILRRRLRRAVRQRREVETFIAGIQDSQLRQIIQLRFVDGLSWQNVTIKIGGGNSEKALQKRVYETLKFGGQSRKNP